MLAPCDTLGREPPSAGTWPGSPGHNRRSAAIIADPPKRGVQRPRLQPETIGCAWGTRMLEMTGPQGLRERAPYPASPVRAARQPDCPGGATPSGRSPGRSVGACGSPIDKMLSMWAWRASARCRVDEVPGCGRRCLVRSDYRVPTPGAAASTNTASGSRRWLSQMPRPQLGPKGAASGGCSPLGRWRSAMADRHVALPPKGPLLPGEVPDVAGQAAAGSRAAARRWVTSLSMTRRAARSGCGAWGWSPAISGRRTRSCTLV